MRFLHLGCGKTQYIWCVVWLLWDDANILLPACFAGGLSVALASGGSLPITSLDATGNLVFANAGGAPNIVTAPLFLNPQNLSLLTSNPVSLVSAAAASAGNTGPVASLHATSTSAEPLQTSLFTAASASGAASTTTASKAQWAGLSDAASPLLHSECNWLPAWLRLKHVMGFLLPCCKGKGEEGEKKKHMPEKKDGNGTTFA